MKKHINKILIVLAIALSVMTLINPVNSYAKAQDVSFATNHPTNINYTTNSAYWNQGYTSYSDYEYQAHLFVNDKIIVYMQCSGATSGQTLIIKVRMKYGSKWKDEMTYTQGTAHANISEKTYTGNAFSTAKESYAKFYATNADNSTEYFEVTGYFYQNE